MGVVVACVLHDFTLNIFSCETHYIFASALISRDPYISYLLDCLLRQRVPTTVGALQADQAAPTRAYGASKIHAAVFCCCSRKVRTVERGTGDGEDVVVVQTI